MPQKSPTLGQIIRRIRTNEFSYCYALYGGDSFMEDYFISELSKNFLGTNGKKIFFSMDQDSDEEIFRELSAISMFQEKRIIIIREVPKIRSNKSRNEMIQYLRSPNPLIILLIISNDYDLKKTFLKNIADLSILLDFRTPFKNKMIEWVRYIMKSKNIQITDDAIKYYINIYGDSISHVVNEIDKTSIFLKNEIIDLNNINKLQSYDRTFQIWQFQDSIGKKELYRSIEILNSLLENGISVSKILINLFYMYRQILLKKMGYTNLNAYTGINKIISSNIIKYDKKYNREEIIQVFYELQKIDLLIKSTALNPNILLQTLIIRICNNLYD